MPQPSASPAPSQPTPVSGRQMPMPQAPQPSMGIQPTLVQSAPPMPQHGAPQQASPYNAPQQGMPVPQPMAPQPSMPVQGHPQHMQPHPQGQPQPPMGQPPMPQNMGQAPMGYPPMGGQLPPMPAPNTPHINAEDEDREGGEKALPTISIHAFCDRQETASIINQTTHDWRMKRTNMKIYMGGLLAAIDFYQQENTPGLILVETGMRGSELFAQLESLASVCDEGTKVVIIGAANDIRLYRQLMEKGVSDYIVPPLLPLNIIRSIGDLYTDPEAPFIGRVAAFFGAKGGVGSSTLAHNLAWCVSEHLGQETALVDLDSSFGTTGLDFAYDASQGLEEALAEPDRLDETLLDRIMIRHSTKLSILPASSSLNAKPIMDEHAYEAVVNGVRSISPLTLLDMPHYWSEWTTNTLISVDDVIITATPDLANLRNTKNLVDFLRAQRPNDADPILILNKTGMTKASEIPVKEFGAAVGLEPSLVISFDPEGFFEAANEGKMLDQVKSAERVVDGLNYLADRLRTGRFNTDLHNGSGKKKFRMPKANHGGSSEKKPLFSFLKKGK